MKYFTRKLAAVLLALLVLAPARAAQNTTVMPTAGPLSMASYSALVNAGLLSIVSNYSGNTAPAVGAGPAAVQYQFWVDTSTTPPTLRIYDGTQWLGVGLIDTSSHAWKALLPNPSPTSLGGVNSYVAVAHQWIDSIGTNGLPHSAQPAFSDISGVASPSQLPAPTSTTLGGVKSLSSLSHNFLTQIGTDGSVSQAQPAFTDISGVAAPSQLPAPTASTLGGVQSFAAVPHQWINTISTGGVPGATQPACGDLSNSSPSCSTDATNAANISSGTLPAARLPNPSATTLGGVQSLAKVTHKWIDSISSLGVPAASQPACGDLSDSVASCSTDTTNAANISSGTLPAGRLPTPTAITLGGVKSLSAVTHKFLTQIGTDGSVSQAQPVCGDLSDAVASCSTDTTNAANISSGTLPAGRLPNPAPTTLGGVKSKASVASNFLTQIGTDGSVSAAQPAFSDISGTATASQLPTPTSSTIGGVKSKASVAHQFLNQIGTDGSISSAQPACGDLSDATASCNTDATNASNITSGTLPNARLSGVAFTANNLSDLASAKTARSNLNIDQLTKHGDSNYTILTTDRGVTTNTTLTAPRTWTLPAANAYNAGQVLVVVDGAGGVSPTNTITVAAAGTDTVNGSGTALINSQFSGLVLWSDGVSAWYFIPAGSGAGTGTVTSVTCGAGLSGGSITVSGTCAEIKTINSQTGSSYTVVSTDQAKALVFNASADVSVTLPQPGGSFPSSWYTTVFNYQTAGSAVTITPTTSTINGASNLVLLKNEAAIIISDGTNYTAITFRRSQTVNNQTGTSYTVLSSDMHQLVTFSNASSIAVTLPQAGSGGFQAGWWSSFQNRGAGAVTITPATSTVDGASSLQLLSGQGVVLYSDGTNYFTTRGMGASAASNAEQKAASTTQKFTSPGTQKYHPLSPKAWAYVTFTYSGNTSGSVSSVDAGTDQITWSAAHGFNTGDIIYIRGGTWPTGVVASSVYYVRAISSTVLALYNTPGDAAANTNKVDLTSTTTGGTASRWTVSTVASSGMDSNGGIEVVCGSASVSFLARVATAFSSSSWAPSMQIMPNSPIAAALASPAGTMPPSLTTTTATFTMIATLSAQSWTGIQQSGGILGASFTAFGDLP